MSTTRTSDLPAEVRTPRPRGKSPVDATGPGPDAEHRFYAHAEIAARGLVPVRPLTTVRQVLQLSQQLRPTDRVPFLKEAADATLDDRRVPVADVSVAGAGVLEGCPRADGMVPGDPVFLRGFRHGGRAGETMLGWSLAGAGLASIALVLVSLRAFSRAAGRRPMSGLEGGWDGDRGSGNPGLRIRNSNTFETLQRIAAGSPLPSGMGSNGRLLLTSSMVLVYKASMKLIARIQLRPAPEDAAKLRVTMERFNRAADYRGRRRLRAIAPPTSSTSAGSATATSASSSGCRARWLNSPSRRPAMPTSGTNRGGSTSRKHAAIPYDQRTMSFQGQRSRQPLDAGRPGQGPVHRRPP